MSKSSYSKHVVRRAAISAKLECLKHLLELPLVHEEQLCGHSNGKYYHSSGQQCSGVHDHGYGWSDNERAGRSIKL
eukprot:11348-Heterococcus_DN1.PRE.1